MRLFEFDAESAGKTMFSLLKSFFRKRSGRTNNSRRGRVGLQFEVLEDRLTPVLFFTADLAITQSSTPTVNVAPGQDVDYTLTITNNGPNSVSSFNVVD